MRADNRVGAEDAGPFNTIFKFTDIARPMINHQGIDGHSGNTFDIFAVTFIEFIDEEISQNRNIIDSFAQGRYVNRENIDTVI